MPEFYIFLLLGGFLIVLEVLVGFVVFWYFVFGLACILTALTSLIFPGWESALGFFAAYTVLSLVIIFKWIKPRVMQSNQESWHDLIGQMLEVSNDILPGSQGGTVRWSGVNWKARLVNDCEVQVISKGDSVCVESISGTTLFVRPAQNSTDTEGAGSADASVKDATDQESSTSESES